MFPLLLSVPAFFLCFAMNFNSFGYKVVLVILLLPAVVLGWECTCNVETKVHDGMMGESLKYKLGAVASILVAGAIGVSIPILGRRFQALKPENDIFFMIKAFAAGVILATGFIHILPDAFLTLNSPCLPQNPWREFPFPGLFAMLASIGTLMIDTFATSLYTKMHFNKHKQVNADIEEAGNEHAGHVHIHTHATHGHAHGAAVPSSLQVNLPSRVRQRIISQVINQTDGYSFLLEIACKSFLCQLSLYFPLF